MYHQLLKSPNSPIFITASYDGEDQKAIIIQVAEFENDLVAVQDHVIEHKSRKKWCIERMLKESHYVKRFANPQKRFTSPPLTHFHTDVESSDFENTVNRDPTFTPASTEVNSASHSTVCLPPLPSSFPAAIGEHSSTIRHGDPHQTREGHSVNFGNYSSDNIDNFVRRHNFVPNTVESVYFLCGVILKKLSVLDARSKDETKMILSNLPMSDAKGQISIRQMSTFEEISTFKENLSDPEFRQSAIDFLRKFAGGCGKELIRRTLRRLFSDEVLSMFNRHGTDGKHKFMGDLEDFVKESVLKSDAKLNSKTIEEVIVNVIKVSQKTVKNKRRMSGEENLSPQCSKKKSKRVPESDM